MCLGECFLDETNIYTDGLCEKQTVLHCVVGLTQSVAGLHRTERLIFPLELQYQLFPRSCQPIWQIWAHQPLKLC